MFPVSVVALFPELIEPVLEVGVVGRARNRGLVDFAARSPRDFTHDRHRTVDDRPYGGGPGMVMRYEPVRDAVQHARAALPAGVPTLVMSAQGRLFDQATAQELAGGPGLLLVAGRYEGIDERIVRGLAATELSLGDYVLSGGELAAAVVIDAVVRLLPGVLGHEDSPVEDSFVDGLLDCPHYTRPESIDGLAVPAVLLGGDHGAVRRWRLKQALGRTWLRRPELIERRGLTAEEAGLLAEFRSEHGAGDED
jgi:tRNA (guanine37-N1)-methyltransferase